MFSNSTDLINDLKSNNQDFEFYPTTNEIIGNLIRDLKLLNDKLEHSYDPGFETVLDIGAGNGKVLKALNKAFDVKMYAIEKSNTLQTLLNENAYIIGTDFNEQTLIDKTMDITFCNPPYSEYVKWTNKIIRESCSKHIYLVIPERWKDNQEIQESIMYRSAKTNLVGEYNFVNSEDRKARAKVNLLRIDLNGDIDDAFDTFFYQEFKTLADKENSFEKKKNYKDNQKFSSLVCGKDFVHSLVELYNHDINNIRQNYSNVQELDISILKEFGVDVCKILDLLKTKLKDLKVTYWNEIISRMDKITDKLTSKKRKSLLETLNKNGYVDFTESNVYAVVLWILRNASNYIDEQLIEVYEKFIEKANCKNYKSNEKVFVYDRWRYEDEKPSHVYLDFRLILSFWGSFVRDYGKTKISDTTCHLIQDLLTVANTLGFNCNTIDDRLDDYCWSTIWQPGKPQIFEYTNDGKYNVLFEVKVHLNGNLHFRLNQEFALALNVEFGRLKKWIHSGKEASSELKNKKAASFFKPDKQLIFSPFAAIEHKPAPVIKKKVVITKSVIKTDAEKLDSDTQVDLFVKTILQNIK